MAPYHAPRSGHRAPCRDHVFRQNNLLKVTRCWRTKLNTPTTTLIRFMVCLGRHRALPGTINFEGYRVLIVFGGLPGTGKTTIAKAIAKRYAAVYLRVDTI